MDTPYEFKNYELPGRGDRHRISAPPSHIVILVQHAGRMYQQVISGGHVKSHVCHLGSPLERCRKKAEREYPDYWIVELSLRQYGEMGGFCRIGTREYTESLVAAIARVKQSTLRRKAKAA